MGSTAVIPSTPLRQSSMLAYDSSTSSAGEDAGDSGFSWTSSSESGYSFSSSPATSAFSSSPSSSRSPSTGKPSYGRRRASTSASNTLESFAKLNTLEEQDAESNLVDAESLLHAAPSTMGAAPQAMLFSSEILQSPIAMENELHTITAQSEILSATAEPRGLVAVEITAAPPRNGDVTENSDIQISEPTIDPVRPVLRTKLSHKLFLKSRERASSLSKLSFVRPKLDTTGGAEGSTIPTDSNISSPNIPNAATARRNALSRLQDRFARSAPSSPPLTPSESTDRVHLFRSRPSSIVLRGRGVEFNYFTSPLSDHSASQPSSCNVSDYQPALDRMGTWGSGDDLAGLATNEDFFQDALPRDLFDTLLPREIKLRIFSLVVQASIDAAESTVQERIWTAARAARERWIGQGAGLRELVKMTRVCREWRDLAFDGQLWQNVYISKTLGCNTFHASGLVRLATHAGSFLRRLDLRGFAQLEDADLEEITESCISHSGVTSLTYIDLSGCNGISTKALHFLLAVSPALEYLNVRGLTAVVSSTCYVVLSSTVASLKILDVSLCRNLLAGALLEMKQPELKELYASKIPSMDSNVASHFPSQFPMLCYLDLGYSRYISDETFKRWPDKEEGGTALRGLRLSGCARLTDQTCLNLVGKVPDLEYLELASIGGNLRNGGLVKLITACPGLKKIDLEDATNLTDSVLTALTPPKRHRGPPSVLEHLNVTNVPELSEAALVKLIKGCPNLRNIEASNSFNVSDLFIKTFMHHVKKHTIQGAEMALVDCRSVTRQAVKEQVNVVRPRRGVKDYASRHFGYMEADGRGKGLAECDESKVVVHSFWTWQQVDEAEGAARSLRTAKLAREAGVTSGFYNHPFTLRGARRASFGMRGGSDGAERTGSLCIIS